MIPWDKEVVNMMEENFVWKSGQSTVTIVASGLYKVEVGLYKDPNIEDNICYLILNGEPISTFKIKEIIKHSKNQARGSLFSEPLLLPAKSRIGIRV